MDEPKPVETTTNQNETYKTYAPTKSLPGVCRYDGQDPPKDELRLALRMHPKGMHGRPGLDLFDVDTGKSVSMRHIEVVQSNIGEEGSPYLPGVKEAGSASFNVDYQSVMVILQVPIVMYDPSQDEKVQK